MLVSLSVVSDSATPRTVAHQASLSFSTSGSLLKLMSIESGTPSNHLILCCCFSSCLKSFQASGLFPMVWLFASGGQSIGASASASVLPINIENWSPSGLTGLFSSVSHVWLSANPWTTAPGLPVHHQFPEFTQTHAHWVSNAIQPSHPLLSPSPPAFNLSQLQGLFKWVSFSHLVAKVLEFQLQLQSFQWIPRTDLL